MIVDGTSPRSRRNWTVVWIVFGVLILIGEAAGGVAGEGAQSLAGGITLQRWWWFAAIGWFVVWEYVAVVSAEGGTFSHTIWQLYADKWGRIPLVVGITGYLAMCLVSTLSTFDPELSRLIVLASGVGIWLLIHFLSGGRYG